MSKKKIEPFAITTKGLVVGDLSELSRQDCLNLESQLMTGCTQYQWAMGDYLVHIGKKYGRTYEVVAATFNESPSYLSNLKYVAKAWPLEERTDRPFSHHKATASIKDAEKRKAVIASSSNCRELEKAARTYNEELEEKTRGELNETEKKVAELKETLRKKTKLEKQEVQDWKVAFIDYGANDNESIISLVARDGSVFIWTTPEELKDAIDLVRWRFSYEHCFVVKNDTSFDLMLVFGDSNNPAVPVESRIMDDYDKQGLNDLMVNSYLEQSSVTINEMLFVGLKQPQLC